MTTHDEHRKGDKAPDPMQSDVGRPEPVKETARGDEPAMPGGRQSSEQK